MNRNLRKIIAEYDERLRAGHGKTELGDFFNLLFNSDEVIQGKTAKNVHPADAVYIKAGDVSAYVESIYGSHEVDGYRFCCNPVPAAFVERIDEICQYEETCKEQFVRMAKELRNELRLTSDLFPYARTLFIEADKDVDGNPLDTVEAKRTALSKLLETDVPISFITDTGGNAPHIGIVFEENLSPSEFKETVKLILSRLPTWVDTAVGKINQLGRIPGTYRVNKKGEKVPVTLLYLGSRVSKSAVDEWIDCSSVTNPKVLEIQSSYVEDEGFEVGDSTDPEQAAWNFISEHRLRHSKTISGNKIQVGCPNRENHKSGDKNMSVFINVKTGQVWCSACQQTVGRTFKEKKGRSASLFNVLSNLERKTAIGATKVKKLF